MNSEISVDLGRSGTPRLFARLVRALARRMFVHENVEFGRDFRVGRQAVVSSPHGLRIGNHVSIGPYSIVQVDGEIEDLVLIGMGVQIVGRNDHLVSEVGVPIVNSTWVADRPPMPSDRVRIGRDVWIGGGSIVLSGVTIGEGSVIGSGAVVTTDIPEYSIAVGVPARVIKPRFANASEIEQHRRALDKIVQEACT